MRDLEQLAADLEATDDEAAVVQQYEDALSAKAEVRCKFGRILVLLCLHISKFARVLEDLEYRGGVGREAISTVVRERRVNQYDILLCTTCFD